MRRKRSQSPLTTGIAVSPHRTTRASSRSPRILGSKAIISPSKESQHSVNCEAPGHINGGSHSRHGSGSPDKLSIHDGADKEVGSSIRRPSSRVSKTLSYHENDSEEEINAETKIESRSRSLRRGGKRENNDSGSTRNKRFKKGSQRSNPNASNHSFITTDDVRLYYIFKIVLKNPCLCHNMVVIHEIVCCRSC